MSCAKAISSHLDAHPEYPRDLGDEVDIEAAPLIGRRVLVGHRRIGRLDADHEGLGSLDLLRQGRVLRHCRDRQKREKSRPKRGVAGES